VIPAAFLILAKALPRIALLAIVIAALTVALETLLAFPQP
jgi:hypothetical protein